MKPQEDEKRAILRAEWADSPIYNGQVTLGGLVPGGAGSKPSTADLNPPICLAYAKPAFDNAGSPEGAHEFIASELAYLLGISVPPVGFWTNEHGVPYALSVRAFRQAQTLGQANLSNREGAALRPIFLQGLVFHTWICDPDHSGAKKGQAGHPRNVVVDARSPPGRPQISFIDHAFALTKSWAPTDGPAKIPANYYVEPGRRDAKTIAATIESVHGISGDAVKSLISRIPNKFLAERSRILIYDCLRRRSDELEAAFARVLGR